MASMTLPNTTDGYVLQPDEGKHLSSLRVRLLATGDRTGGGLSALVCVNPGPGGPPLHTHHAHDELYLVLDGQYRFKIGEDEYEGGPGTFAYVPRGAVHTFASVGVEEGRLFSTAVPSGLEGFLEGLNELSARGGTEEELVALHRRYRSEINGPALV